MVFMVREKIPHLVDSVERFVALKANIIESWFSFDIATSVLQKHLIDVEFFKTHYAANVFDYFIAVIRGQMKLGQCPVMTELLDYFKDRDISADELFIICSHFRRAMIDESYNMQLNTKELFDEISYLFDLNFSGLLKLYTDTIFQKEQEIQKNVHLLDEYKKALDASAIVSKTDSEGVITYVNENFTRLCGYSDEELIGRKHTLMRHNDMQEAFFADLWQTISQGDMYRGTIKNYKKNGDYFYIDTTIVPIENPFNKRVEYIAIGYEVTSFVDAKVEALEAASSKEYFLSNMSHEIRTPLNAIIGFVSLMRDDNLSETHEKYLNIIYNSSESLLKIINDILDFSKLRTGEFGIELGNFNVHDTLSEVLELFVASANEKNIALLSFIAPDIPNKIEQDELRIKQIISNLLSNAIKFSPQNSSIELYATYENEVLCVQVKDHGIGIEKSHIEKIFDPFSQISNSDELSGTGLGLSICKRLSEHMGGDVYVESKPLQGSSFFLELPAKAKSEENLFSYDIRVLNRLNMAFLVDDIQEDNIAYTTLSNCFQMFGNQLSKVDSIDTEAYDMIFFSDELLSESRKKALIEANIIAIAIVKTLSPNYDRYKNITELNLPIYFSKLYNTFLEALGLNEKESIHSEIARRMSTFNAHVLVAEDNIANQELIKTILDKYRISYYIASDGLEALNVFQQVDFDLIIMDEQMPRMDGIEASRKIKAINKLMPIVALSANVIESDAKSRMRENIYDDFLGKPINISKLEEIFRKYLQEGESYIKEDTASKKKQLQGMDMALIKEELQLDEEEIILLIETFLSKIDETMHKLKEAIALKAYTQISKLAHSIKGSAANFRAKAIHTLAKKLEDAAREESSSLDYEGLYEKLTEEIAKISIA